MDGFRVLNWEVCRFAEWMAGEFMFKFKFMFMFKDALARQRMLFTFG